MVDLPLWKMMEFVNGKYSISYMKWKIKNVPNHQPNEDWALLSHHCPLTPPTGPKLSNIWRTINRRFPLAFHDTPWSLEQATLCNISIWWWFLHVVTILKNMGVRQWEGWHPFFIMENNKNVWNHQPAIGTDIPNCFLDIPNAGAVHPTASQRRPVSPTASFWSSKERNNKRIYIARKCNHLRNLHHP